MKNQIQQKLKKLKILKFNFFPHLKVGNRVWQTGRGPKYFFDGLKNTMAENTGTCSLTHVWTEEPNAIKLRAENMLLPMGKNMSFTIGDDTTPSPLAKELLSIDGVTSVKMDAYAVETTFHDEADWEVLGKTVETTIQEFIISGQPVYQSNQDEEKTMNKKFSFGFKEVKGRPREEQMKIVESLLEKEINPAVAAHGGYFNLIDIKDNNVYVELGGGCQGCGMATVTLKQGVETRLREALPEMDTLIDVTDHASGNDPYYQPGK